MNVTELRDRLTERQLQDMICDYARIHGWLIHHDRRDDLSIGGDPGFPDLVLARDGVVIFAELKTAAGQVTASQVTWFDALIQNDGEPAGVHLWRPSDWPAIQELLR